MAPVVAERLLVLLFLFVLLLLLLLFCDDGGCDPHTAGETNEAADEAKVSRLWSCCREALRFLEIQAPRT